MRVTYLNGRQYKIYPPSRAMGYIYVHTIALPFYAVTCYRRSV